jgi:5'(3')-deoxyribonucleotidase
MKNKPKRIALDIDNVSVDTATYVLNQINEKYGTDLTIEDIQEWNQKWNKNGKNIDYTKELFRNFDTPNFINSVPLMPGADRGIKRLLNEGNEVHFLTGRNNKYKPQTDEWARQIDGDLKTVYAPEGKEHHVKNFDVLLDDAPKEILGVSVVGGNPVVFDRPWNKKIKNLTARRVGSWDEFIDNVKTF